MINRDNLKAQSGNPIFPDWTISVSRNQWAAAQNEIRRCEISLGVRFEISGWGYHTQGYAYKEVKICGRQAEEAANRIQEAINFIPCA